MAYPVASVRTSVAEVAARALRAGNDHPARWVCVRELLMRQLSGVLFCRRVSTDSGSHQIDNSPTQSSASLRQSDPSGSVSLKVPNRLSKPAEP